MIAALLIAFLLVPLAEIYVILQIGHAIGGWATLLLLIVWSLIGAWIVRHEGRRAWGAFRSATEAGRLPGREVADGALVLLGGALLLTPGFITDAVGLVLVLPVTRPLARRALLAAAARRAARRIGAPPRVIRVRAQRGGADPPPPGPWGGPAGTSGEPGGRGQVIQGEIIRRDEERPDGAG